MWAGAKRAPFWLVAQVGPQGQFDEPDPEGRAPSRTISTRPSEGVGREGRARNGQAVDECASRSAGQAASFMGMPPPKPDDYELGGRGAYGEKPSHEDLSRLDAFVSLDH